MKPTQPPNPSRSQPRRLHAAPRRGAVIVIVLWAIALAAVVTGAAQLFSHRQATVAYDVVHRTQARWAARAGIEQNIAVMADHTEQPYADDAFALIRDLEYVYRGEIGAATWDIRHNIDGLSWKGPLDEHSRMNINRADALMLASLERMTPDVLDAMTDWMDEDDEVSGFGAERDYYLALMPAYEPRNGRVRNVIELELVGGVWPKYFRGEDWNLNNRLDPNENDGRLSFPEDKPDDQLSGGWFARLTANSVDGGATASGQPRLYLRHAGLPEIQQRLGLMPDQAYLLMLFGQNEDNQLTMLLNRSIQNIGPDGSLAEAPVNQVEPLTREQLAYVLDEAATVNPLDRPAGRINLNTVSPELLRDLLEFRLPEDVSAEAVAEELLYMRTSRPEGIVSLVELQDIPELPESVLEFLLTHFTTSSNVYTIASRGRSEGTGAEVEIIATVDRSTLPVKILEYREQ